MANLSVKVSRHLQKMTTTGSTVKLNLLQLYEFENVFDLFICLDGFRLDHKSGNLQIKAVRVNSSCLLWSASTNLPVGMSYLEYLKWENDLLREYLNER